jgi:uncharacterized protein
MRMMMTGLALALAAPALAGDVVVQAVTTQPLAANEVLLEINATGSVTSPADLVTLQVMVSASGETEQQARSAAEAQIARIVAAARAAGIAPADIETGEIGTNGDMMMMNAMTMDTNMAGDPADMSNDMSMMAPISNASATVELRLRNVARLDGLSRALSEAGAYAMPVYSLADASGPRREARTRALAAARADAEAYAAALGLRVVRIVRVTERGGVDFFSMMMNEGAMRRSLGGMQNEPDIETTMSLGVDFALAPR